MTKEIIFVHTFRDGSYEQAYRWTNPDGSEGGTIAKSAILADGVFVPHDCEIGPNAMVADGVHIGGLVVIGRRASVGYRVSIGKSTAIGIRASIDARVSIGSNARIGNGASIGSHAHIGDSVVIGNGASIADDVSIYKDDWLFVAGPQGSRNAFVTVTYSKNYGLRWWVGCQDGITTDKLRKRIAAEHGENGHAQEYLHLIAFVESHPGLERKKAEIAAKSEALQ